MDGKKWIFFNPDRWIYIRTRFLVYLLLFLLRSQTLLRLAQGRPGHAAGKALVHLLAVLGLLSNNSSPNSLYDLFLTSQAPRWRPMDLSRTDTADRPGDWSNTTASVSAYEPAAAARPPQHCPGRKASGAVQEFEIVRDVGARCRHCGVLVKSKKQNGTLLDGHLFIYRSSPWKIQQLAWDTCVTLRNSKPRPADPATLRAASRLPPSVAASATGSRTQAMPASSSQISSLSVLNYMDRITCAQSDAIDAAIMNYLVLKCVPFYKVESNSFLELLKVLRPAYVARKKVPTRRKMAGVMLSKLHGTTREQVLRALANWCKRRKTVLMVYGWENIEHHHISNLLALLGGTAIFLGSIYCGSDAQDAEGQARLAQEKLTKYGDMDTINAVASDNTASCVEIRRLLVAANSGMVSLNDQAHVANLLVGDLCKIGWVASCDSKALLVSSYVRRHSRLLAAYSTAK